MYTMVNDVRSVFDGRRRLRHGAGRRRRVRRRRWLVRGEGDGACRRLDGDVLVDGQALVLRAGHEADDPSLGDGGDGGRQRVEGTAEVAFLRAGPGEVDPDLPGAVARLDDLAGLRGADEVPGVAPVE